MPRSNLVTWWQRLHDGVALIGVIFFKEARWVVPSRKNNWMIGVILSMTRTDTQCPIVWPWLCTAGLRG